MYRAIGKQMLDWGSAAIGLVIAAVPMLVVAATIRSRMGRPVLHRAIRPGFKGRMFVLYKFRTMIDAVDAEGKPLPDKDRVTPFGQFLRKTSLDELPQLFNVLRGDMSLVGPRPLLPAYLDLYTPEQARRHDVKPGITGLAQVNGRNRLDWDQRFALDVHYVDNVSFLLDMRIIGQTVAAVLRRSSISPEGDLDVPFFTGSTPQAGRGSAESGPRDAQS